MLYRTLYAYINFTYRRLYVIKSLEREFWNEIDNLKDNLIHTESGKRLMRLLSYESKRGQTVHDSSFMFRLGTRSAFVFSSIYFTVSVSILLAGVLILLNNPVQIITVSVLALLIIGILVMTAKSSSPINEDAMLGIYGRIRSHSDLQIRKEVLKKWRDK